MNRRIVSGKTAEKKLTTPTGYGNIHTGIVDLLEAARRAAARSVNTRMTASYWEIGRRIVEFEQGGKGRADYGLQLLKRLSTDLTARFGRGFGVVNLQQMRNFYLCWPPQPIYQTLSDKSLLPTIHRTPSDKSAAKTTMQTLSANSIDLATLAARFPLPWSVYVCLLSVKNEAARAFYETEALRCGWSVRQLDRQIGSQFYERIALSKNKAAMLKKAERAEPHDLISPEEAIKDPFVLEFLALKDEYSESDLEDALIQRLADFLLELGDDFTFLGRQRRLRIVDSTGSLELRFAPREMPGIGGGVIALEIATVYSALGHSKVRCRRHRQGHPQSPPHAGGSRHSERSVCAKYASGAICQRSPTMSPGFA